MSATGLDYTWHELTFMVYTLTSVTVTGLLGVWIALGRGHWFARVAVSGAAVGLPILLPVFELLVLPAVQLIFTVPVLVVARRIYQRRDEPRRPWQFGLRDLLLLTLVVAALAAAASSAPPTVWESDGIPIVAFDTLWRSPAVAPWIYLLSFAAALAAATCLGVWISLGRARPRYRLTGLIVSLIAMALLAGLVNWRNRVNPPSAGGFPHSPKIFFGEVLAGCALVASVLTAVWLWLLRVSSLDREVAQNAPPDSDAKRPWLRWPARVALVLLTLVLVGPVAVFDAVMLTRPAVPEVVLPEPNGYTRLVALGKRLEKVGVPVDNSSMKSLGAPQYGPQDYLDFARDQRELLLAASKALELPSVVPVVYGVDDLSPRIDDNQALRWLARAMQAAGEAERIKGNFDEAARWDVDLMRLGRAVSKGDLITDWLVGSAVEQMGQHAMHGDLLKLSATQRRELASTVEALGEQGETLEAAKQRDSVWCQHAYSWFGRPVYCIDELTGKNTAHRKMLDIGAARCRAFSRLLKTELALEAYRDKHGRYPDRLDELVPDVLEQMPLDPFVARPFHYWSTFGGQAYSIYSVGPDGNDDKGKSDIGDPELDDVQL